MVGSSDDDQYTDDNVPSGIFYYRVIGGLSEPVGWRRSILSHRAPAMVDTTQAAAVPNAPLNLAASEVTADHITLTWTDNSVNEAGFEIRRSTSLLTDWANMTLVGRVTQNATSFTDNNLVGATDYYYAVAAYTIASVSPATLSYGVAGPEHVSDSFGTPVIGPTQLQADTSQSNMALSWTASSVGFGRSIQRLSTNSGPFEQPTG